MKHQSLDDQGLLSFAHELGQELLHWDFGPIMEMRHDPSAKNYLFSSEAVPFHWDGAFHREPKFLVFYCTRSEGAGGETLFTNTTALWNSLTNEGQALARQIRLRFITEKKAHYGGEITVPLVQTHPQTGATILRMAESVETELNPVGREVLGPAGAEELIKRLEADLYDPRFLVSHAWEEGDLLVCDNFTFLHGRRALGPNLARRFKRVQIL